MAKCFGYRFYNRSSVLAQYALTVTLMVIYLGLLIAFCVVRKKTGAGKQLIGLPYAVALFFMFM